MHELLDSGPQQKQTMANRFAHLQDTFRKAFTLSNNNVVQWFPGHMQKGLLQIQAKLKKIDCIVEIHDARVPYSGRNLRLRDLIQLRPHILLLNKVDLTDLQDNDAKRNTVIKTLRGQGVDNVYFTSFRGSSQSEHIMNTILPTARELIESKPRYSREGQDDYNLLLVGIPNVGKSTFINTLRTAHLHKKGKATTVGAMAGVTKSVMSKIKVSSNPAVYIIDTPGIMPPKIPGLETGMRLAACACLPDHLVGLINIADYILFWLNSRKHFQYVDHFELEEPSDNILDILARIAIKNNKIVRVKSMATNQFVHRPNSEVAAQMFFTSFREGKLGKFLLDDDY